MTTGPSTPGDSARAAEDPAPTGEDLAALLARLLGETDKTQKDLAAEAGIKYPTLNAWMNRTRGTSRINPDDLRALANILRGWGVETTPRQIFEAAGRPVPGPTDVERENRLLEIYRQLPARSQRALLQTAEAMRQATSAA
ncbi:helix-turn-helix transcriptional regulator [Streptomyces sp. AM 2-1-1]|uniref:helix-turn-helix domain-containing protein n=1 Tax=Streptomyces sp. AM 2-1-1 TaxID=3028709 RepID=UPI0023B9357A|nr:helix-turn-helix transcriptional regulator [Streptomyces sp. AM 2-1-1]WEH40750.1 helix-turn-helix transcriptional regulator [Streptomyces sp. AM 2-1-1]